jgi:hypothetical protein
MLLNFNDHTAIFTNITAQFSIYISCKQLADAAPCSCMIPSGIFSDILFAKRHRMSHAYNLT